jgi:hypothetical protein
MDAISRRAICGICLALALSSCSALPRAAGTTTWLAAIPRSQERSLVAPDKVVWQAGHSYTEFDVPSGIGTFAYAIDDAGDVAGTYFGGPQGDQGFLRAQDGTIIDISPPGGLRTYVDAMNRTGEIAGYAGNDGFVRDPNGLYTVFSPPGAAYTEVFDINDSSQVTGFIVDAANMRHGFVRNSDGSIVVFDAPSSGVTTFDGTDAFAINSAGAVVGTVGSASGQRGYERFPNGTITEFDVPRKWVGDDYITPISINSGGEILGDFEDGENPRHTVGFVRSASGHFTIFAIPNATYTFPDKINGAGQVIGASGTGVPFDPEIGFLRGPNGGITTIAPPGAYSTTPIGLDHLGRIVGSYTDTAVGTWHGFIRQ